MPSSTLQNEARLVESQAPVALPGRTVLIVVAGIVAAWVAAGSLGWMALALQKVLTWAALALVIGAAWPACGGPKARGTLLATAAAALLMTALAMPVVNVLAVVVLLAVIAGTQPAAHGRAVLAASLAAATLAVFHMACQSAAAAWTIADAMARLLGSVAGWAAGWPLALGASLAGLDLLVLMAALWVGWVAKPQAAAVPRPRSTWYLAAGSAAAAIVLVHAAYLLVLAWSCDLAAALPPAVPPPATDVSRLGFWSWSLATRAWLPWGLPVLAAAGQAAVALAMFRLARWQASSAARPSSAGPGSHPVPARPLNFPPTAHWALPTACGLAVVAALALLLDSPHPDLKGLRVMAYQTGGIQWDLAGKDQPAASVAASAAAPSFGLLGPLVESLGGQLDRSTTLTEPELAEHNVLLLLPPGPKELASWMAHEGSGGGAGPVADGSPHLFSAELQARILEFVRRGGALLVAAAPESHPGAIENVFNELLAPTGIRVEDETARSMVPCWEDNVEATAPAVRGGRASPGASFGLDRPAGLRVAWPAGPLLIGRWAWGEPGAGVPPTAAYRPGQRLGDLVLAAQRPLGRGRVVVLGDAACLSDRRLPSSYPFIARLLASLAANSDGPLALWRQCLGLAALAGFLGLVAWRAAGAGSEPCAQHQDHGRRLAIAAGVLAVAVAGCTLAGDAGAGLLLPEGRPQSARPLVYVDASHVAAAATDPEQEDGLGQWTEVLAHNGYLPLWAPDLSPARLKRAAILVLVAPARPLSSTERETVREFVEGGGGLLAMVGAEESGPSLPLLAEYDLSVPEMPQPPSVTTPEPKPLGAATQAYVNAAGESAEAQFYAAWPAESQAQQRKPIFPAGPERAAAMVSQRVGSGGVVLIADTYFATNKNFQAEESDSRHNVHFWGWLLAGLTGHKPPAPPETEPAGPSERGPLDAAGPKQPVQPEGKVPFSLRENRDSPRSREPTERGILEDAKASEAKP
jgi:hypothetical protein